MYNLTMNFYEKIQFVLKSKIANRHQELILEKLDIDYLIKKNNIDFKFYMIDENDRLQSDDINKIYINQSDLDAFVKIYKNISVDKLALLFNDKTIFYITKKAYDNGLGKVILSWIYNTSSKVCIIDEDSYSKQESLKRFIKSNNAKIKNKIPPYRLKPNFYQQCNLYVNNIISRKYTNKIKFFNFRKTLNDMQVKNIIRIGDGEFDLMNGISCPYQHFNKNISNELKKSLVYFAKNNLLAINDKIIHPYIYANDRNIYQDSNIKYSLAKYIKKSYSANVWGIPPYIWATNETNYLFAPKSFLVDGQVMPIDSNKIYRYGPYKKMLTTYNGIMASFFKRTINNKKVVIITGRSNEQYIKDYIFKFTKNIEFVYTKEYDSYDDVKVLKDFIKKNKKQNIIYLLLCGPCGKVIARDIDLNNQRFIDIGNFVNYQAYYNDLLKIDSLSLIHDKKRFLKLKNK